MAPEAKVRVLPSGPLIRTSNKTVLRKMLRLLDRKLQALDIARAMDARGLTRTGALWVQLMTNRPWDYLTQLDQKRAAVRSKLKERAR